MDLNLAFRWFCRLGLDGRVPDHSTFTKNRHGRFRASDLLREVFERLVEQCFRTGLASAEHIAVDGSHVLASADHHRRVAGEDGLPREAATQAVREYWEGLDAAVPDLEGVERTSPKHVSLTDPAAAWSIKHGPGRFAYGLNAMVDTGSGIVFDVQAAPARLGDEPKASRLMIERLRDRHGLTPSVLTADKAYGSGPFLGWLEGRGTEAHIRVIEHLRRHERRPREVGLLPRSAFICDRASDSCTCPTVIPARRVPFRRSNVSEPLSARRRAVEPARTLVALSSILAHVRQGNGISYPVGPSRWPFRSPTARAQAYARVIDDRGFNGAPRGS